MWKRSRRVTLGLGLGLGISLWLGASSAAGSPGDLRALIERELHLTRTASDLERGLVSLDAERESLDYAAAVIGHRGAESLRRLEAYRVSRSAREHQGQRRTRVLYKLARGGFLKLALEDLESERDAGPQDSPRSRSRAHERVLRGRSVRWLVAHDLQELSVHKRAEARARRELLATVRELQALSALRVVQDMESRVATIAQRQLDPALASTHRARRRMANRDPKARKRESALLSALERERRELRRARGLDLLEQGALRRPVPGRVIGPFGAYDDPVLRVPMQRNGVELAARQGKAVVALAPGEVAFVGELPGFSEVVVLDHGGGYISLTGRLLGVEVELGQEVEAGARLGSVAAKAIDDGLGTTVYLELRHAERPIDPQNHL